MYGSLYVLLLDFPLQASACVKQPNRFQLFTILIEFLWLSDSVLTLKGDGGSTSRAPRLDCVKANDQCLKEYSCGTKYRMMRQCVAGRESNFSAVTGTEAQGECRSAIDAMKQSSLNNCRCRRGMKKEKNCLRIFWSIFQSLQGELELKLSCGVNAHSLTHYTNIIIKYI